MRGESTLLEAVKWPVCARCGTKRPAEVLVPEFGEGGLLRCRDADAIFCSDPKGERRVSAELLGGGS